MVHHRKPLVGFDVLVEAAIAACQQLRAEVDRMERLPGGDLRIPRGTRGDSPTALVLIAELHINLGLCNGWRPSPSDLGELLDLGVTFEQAIPFENPTIREPICRLDSALPRFFGDQQPTVLPVRIIGALDRALVELPPVLVRWRASFVGQAKHLVADAAVAVGGSKPPALVDVSEAPDEFRLEGSAWVVRFGGAQKLVTNSRGMGMLAELIVNEGSGVSSVVLDGTAVVPGVDQDVMDKTALREMQAKLEAVSAQRAHATATENADLAARVDVEFLRLERELKRAKGLGGRSRKLRSEAQRVRDRVGDALTAAIAHIKACHPRAGEHLDQSVTKRYSESPVYRPQAPRPVWVVSRE